MTKTLNITVEHELSMERTVWKPVAPEVNEANGASRAKRRHRRLHCSTSRRSKPARKTLLRSIGAALGTTRTQYEARLVSSLVQARYLRQVGGGYLLGPKPIELGMIALEQMPLTAVARPHLQVLAEYTHDTIHLGVRDGDDVLYIDEISGTRGLEMRSRVGHRMPLASTGIGKAMMLDLRPRHGRSCWRRRIACSRR